MEKGIDKAAERALEKYPVEMYEEVGWRCVDKNSDKRKYFIEGYHQAEKDLLANKHGKSWRLDEKFWKGIKDIEEASYQYTYDASNDWAYDVPTWDDVQDAFKAGSEWKENYELTWEDIRDICRMWMESITPFGVTGEALSIEVLKRFRAMKNEEIR